MATTATKLLQLRPKLKSNPSLPLFFSSSSEAPPEQPKTPSEQQPQQSKPFSFSSIAGTRVTSSSSQIEESRKALAGFRSRTNLPPPDASAPPSFRELYNSTNTRPPRFDFNSLRGGLRNLSNNNSTTKLTDSLSLKQLKDSLKLRPGNEDDTRMRVSSRVIGGTEMRGIFRKEEEGGKGENMKTKTRTEFVKMYSHNELGRKLQMLRPPGKKDGFSLQELNDRLVKLREIEDKESESSIAGSIFKDLKASLLEIRNSEDDKSKKSIIQRLDVLGQIGSTPSFMSHPPKEHLVEKYFLPDNMSSEEKMKLELQKVRDEFKMSESDCGSARVQVAQLTTKIKHLSTVLHKKDKHSRKGLQGMVQKRKKLLKYLRKTDWDSYCLVLSKLGLRDNPDYKL